MGVSATSNYAAKTAKRKAHTWWIDELGRWNSIEDLGCDNDPVLNSPLGFHMMYRYYGMVRLEERGRRLACDWDVRAACPGALETAGRYLRRAGRPVILRFYFGGWQEEYFDNPEIACQRMATSSVYAQAEPLLRPSVLRRPISEARDARRPYGKLLRALEAADGRLTPELQQTLEARGLFRRLVLLEEQAIKGPLIMRHIGEHSGLARFYGPKWRQEALGKPFEQVPFAIEHQYSLFDVYRRTLERREARFDHVRFPVAAGSEELRWISCERLLAPYSLADGRRGVILMSEISKAIALPFMGWLIDGPAEGVRRAA